MSERPGDGERAKGRHPDRPVIQHPPPPPPLAPLPGARPIGAPTPMPPRGLVPGPGIATEPATVVAGAPRGGLGDAPTAGPITAVKPRPRKTDPAAGEAGWLVVVHPDGTRQQVRLTLALTTIGRSDQNVVEVLDPKLSRFHCEVERREGKLFLRDCNSRNGTFLNGAPVTSPRPIKAGDEGRIGVTSLLFFDEPPAELVRSDRAVALQADLAEGTVSIDVAALRVEPTAVFDGRQTQRVEALPPRAQDPWRLLARAAPALLDATSRGELIERAVQQAPAFLQARGVLMVLGESVDQLTVTASLGVDREGRERCLEVGRRVLATRDTVRLDRRAIGLPLRGREDRLQGALVLHDLPVEPSLDSPPVEALLQLAGLVARTLSSSLLVEEVRRDERAQDERRLALDLLALLRPPIEGSPAPGVIGPKLGLASAPMSEVGAELFDRLVGPERAGRREVLLVFGEAPDADAPPNPHLRRRGERGFLPLLGHAELRGALAVIAQSTPRTDDALRLLEGALTTARQGAEAAATLRRAALTLLRFDGQTGALRFTSAGAPSLLLRKADGSVEAHAVFAPALGASAAHTPLTERELRWAQGDVVLVATQPCVRAAPAGGAPLGEEGLRALVEAAGRALAPQALAEHVVAQLLKHAGTSTLPGAAVLVLARP